jgi:hypothetical protein
MNLAFSSFLLALENASGFDLVNKNNSKDNFIDSSFKLGQVPGGSTKRAGVPVPKSFDPCAHAAFVQVIVARVDAAHRSFHAHALKTNGTLGVMFQRFPACVRCPRLLQQCLPFGNKGGDSLQKFRVGEASEHVGRKFQHPTKAKVYVFAMVLPAHKVWTGACVLWLLAVSVPCHIIGISGASHTKLQVHGLLIAPIKIIEQLYP